MLPHDLTEEDDEPICADCEFCVMPEPSMLPKDVHIAWCIDAQDFIDPTQEVPCEW